MLNRFTKIALADNILPTNSHSLFFFQVDASVSTESGTMTEPDCVGPMDPGSSITLDGIVWHETENGEYYLYDS